MSIEEKERASGSVSPPKRTPNTLEQERTFVKQLEQGANADLARPFGIPHWPTLGLVFVLTICATLFFADIIDLGKATINWKLSFNVNLVAGLLVILGGAMMIVPKALKDRQILRSQNTIGSLVILLLVIGFFLFGIIDLGNFVYTLDNLDLGAVVGLLFLGAVLALAIVRRSVIALVMFLGFFLWWGFSIRAFGFVTLTDLFTSSNGGRLLRSLTPPRWEYFAKVIDPMFLTVQTAIAATVIGIVVALPLSMLAARNTSPHPVIYNLVRFIINTIRSIPALILALLFIPFVGLGPGAGVLGLGIHSISVLTKLYAEAFESVKPQPLEALNAVGANGLKTFRWGVFPQAFPLIASYSIFNWESNGRDSTVVAFVGGGGVGFLLQSNLALLDYANVSVLLLVLILTVTLLDRFSDFVRSKII